MLVLNKWNKGVYTLVEKKDSTVVLQRADGSVFEISKKEYLLNYFEKINKK